MVLETSLYEDALKQFCIAVREKCMKQSDKDGDKDGEKQLQQLQDFLVSRATPEEAKASALVLKDCADKRHDNKDWISKDWINNIMANIDKVIDLGQPLIKSAPESVSMAWFCVQLGLKAMQSHHELYSLFGSGLTSMTEILILIPHYDQLYDERQKPGFKSTQLVDKLFQDLTSVYIAVLDFMFSIKRHIETSTLGKFRHALKNVVGVELAKFQAKQVDIATLKAKVLEDSAGVFQEKVFDNFRNVNDSLEKSLKGIRSFASTAEELAQGQSVLLRQLQDVIASVKPKSRWDWLKQDFDENKKALDPLPDDHHLLSDLQSARYPETTSWLLKSDRFTNWKDSKQSAGLCFIGQKGVGKSVALASAIGDLKITMGDEVICLVPCVAADGKHVNLGTRPLERITRSLIYQIYKLAVDNEDKPDVLEECNNLFKRSEANKRQQMPTEKSDENGLPRFGDAVHKLAGILHNNIIFVVDAVDRLPHTDQSGLFDTFRDVMGRSLEVHDPKVTVRVLVTCRTNQTFANSASTSRWTTINIEDDNHNDMALQLSSVIESMADWTTDEREEAKSKVLEKAGRRFGYISEVAIPFLRQPFQRPLSKRLTALPDDITDSYKQAINSMPPNYLDLLRTALAWTLYSAQPVRVKEVIEAFSGTYQAGRDGEVPNDYAFRLGYNATALELQQLLDASGPFLKFTINAAQENIVTPQDYVHIRQFCNQQDQESDGLGASNTDRHCKKCTADIDSTHRLKLTEKQVHLDLALELVRHLNSPLFQKRFELLPGDSSGSSHSDPADESPQEKTEDNGNATKQDEETGREVSDRLQYAGQDEDPRTLDASSDPGATPATVDETVVGGEPVDEKALDGYDTDDSEEDEDRDEGDIIIRKLTGRRSQVRRVEADDGSDAARYELMQWFYHARKADNMWPAGEKAENPQWAELTKELDQFAFENKTSFKVWQSTWAIKNDYIEKGVDPLHTAANLGLTFWVEHLIKDRKEDPLEFSQGRNALQAAVLCSDNDDVLKLLLSLPGMDATVRGTSSPVRELSALQDWLRDPTEETVQLFVDSGADFDERHEESGWSALHFFADGKATNPASLELILKSGYTGGRRKLDINATSIAGNTPLHFLVTRQDVPLDLFKAFIDNGANVNAENESSLRPLQSACTWCEPDLLEILWTGGIEDIDDADDDGMTALHIAAWVGSSDCVEWLLDHEANINCTENHDRSPLHLAARDGHVDTINTLLERGAELNAVDKHDRTPFWWACNGESQESAAALLAALKPKFSVADINMPSKRRRTLLRLAATHGFSEIVEELIAMAVTAGLDVVAMLNLQDTKNGFTALNRAAWRGELDCVRLLLNHGADATLKDMEGNTALILATTQWKMSGEDAFEKIILLLMKKDEEQAKVDPELPSTAALNGSVHVLEELYRIGINVNRADSSGWTPLMHAQRLHKSEAERFLKRQTTWGGVLPSAWVHNTTTAKKHFFALSEDGLKITNKAGRDSSVSTDKPLPAGLDRYYYEVTLRHLPGQEKEEQPGNPAVAIGFCTLGAQCYEFPGWPPKRNTPSGQSWAYHGDDGWLAAGSNPVESWGEPYGPGDTVGCGVDLETRKIWFTKQGRKLEFEHEGVKGRLFPILGLSDRVSLETNFGGKPFMWAEANVDGEGREVGDATAGAASLT